MRTDLLTLLALLTACNVAPEALQVTISPETPGTTDDLVAEVTGAFTDADGDEVTYSFTWYADGEPQEHISELTVSASGTIKHQEWKLFVQPTDGRLEGPPSEAVVTILNTPPSAELTLAPEIPLTTEDVTATINGTDPDGDDITFSYTWTLNGTATGYQDATLPASATERGDIWTLSATPSDGEADGEAALASVSIDNTAPVVSSVALSPAEPREADTITASVDHQDDDGDPVSYSYAWTADDELVLEGDHPILGGEYFDKHQQVMVTVTPNDGFVDGEPLSSEPVTIINTAPSATGASISPTEIYEASELSCAGEGWSDDDDDPEGYQVRWAVDGVDAGTSDTLTGESFGRGDNITCTLIPDDGEDTGDAVQSDPVTVLNTAPAISAVTLSTTSPAEGDTLSATITASDEDGDSFDLAWAWFVEGTQVSTDETIGSDLFDKHQAIHLEVTPSDGADTGATYTSATATAVNTLPAVTGLELSPSELYTDDTITASVSTTDADGDDVTLSYVWTVDGGATTETGSSLDGSTEFDKHQTVAVVVTPNDGEDDGSTATDSVDVLNSPPTAPAVSISPDEPHIEMDDLLCIIDAEATDADGDSISYSFAWDVGGTPYTGPTTTTATSDLVAVDQLTDTATWTCTVTPADSEEDGTAGSASVYVSWFFTGWADTTILSTDADITITGEAGGDEFGEELSAGQDVDGDGLPEVLIGAHYHDDPQASCGKAYLFSGDQLQAMTDLDADEADWIFENNGESTGISNFGWTVDLPGDIDRDGSSEVLVGSDEGAYLYFAQQLSTHGTFGVSDADVSLGSEASRSLDSVEDADGDGLVDLILGERANNGSSTDPGVGLLYLASTITSASSLDRSDADFILNGEHADSLCGSAVAGLDDIDGDGLSELLVGADESLSSGNGGVAVVMSSSLSPGASMAWADADYLLEGDNDGDEAGGYASSASDIDGDGTDDFLVGAADGGPAYLVLGSSLLDGSVLELADADHSFFDSSYLQRVASAGDIDADGLPDIMLGELLSSAGEYRAGACHLFLAADLGATGSHSLSDASYSFAGSTSFDRLSEPHALGDLDNDGLDDILVGAYAAEYGGHQAGEVYLFITP